jgi:hypothetical protein
MEPQDNQQNAVSKELTKRAYQKPQLEVYGDLGEITGTMGKTGTIDGGTGSMSLTSP